ncbi:MAG: excinuclease ABC subunit UvrB [Sedimentisphaerales bacterium]|nr:excinuclease ABC subunit UvrB [Sedimentisphaerales bacterium]HNY79784.1 excinuclease ABC subunit UvrB [Sedimentisphaerales bacterium]HOC62238.1 excinuclease ABC subunit UvrB [Sedimentisphaerales bacterium]HOH63121.1 excinuclease ABC subunit UvrB [Sedimentisphaerales bacterium]HPY50995.1 excinuclease ABC subunit UvrB [Sedimentisphaerales bacterium]
MGRFKLNNRFQPSGDQPQAIERLAAALRAGSKFQTLMGVTGSGKTFTMANVIARFDRPVLVISHNKTLAAQLYEEFRELFPENAVEYFVSYYDYYQPEAYIPQRDIYIEKDASRNADLDRLRLSATTSLATRRDCIVVASVSCIFGLGSPEAYKASMVAVRTGETCDRNTLLGKLADIQYARNDIDFQRGTFRVRGDVVELYPSYESFAIRIEFFGDEIERISYINPVSAEILAVESQVFIYPAQHYIMPADRIAEAVEGIRAELAQRLGELRSQAKLLEAQRLQARTMYDIEMIQEVGYCSGIENYARHLAGLPPGARPYTLIDYFPDDFLLFIDESHVTIPQLRAMWAGDHNRKAVLVEHGFRLPSAMDNRPLRFEEFQQNWSQVVFVSATPAPFELELCGGEVVEQIIRPTGLLDPEIFVHPATNQVEHLLEEIARRVAAHERVLATTLTKRMAENLASYITKRGYRCRYLHSEIDTLERIDILRDLRHGEFDVLVGVNLLREGLDLPEVSCVAILDADKEGFLRSQTSLIQTIGRTARNVNATVLLYADTVTESMRKAIDETGRRRTIQLAYNQEHHITPETIKKEIRNSLTEQIKARRVAQEAIRLGDSEYDKVELAGQIEREMLEAAEALDFERAAVLRDQLRELKELPELVLADSHRKKSTFLAAKKQKRRGKA